MINRRISFLSSLWRTLGRRLARRSFFIGLLRRQDPLPVGLSSCRVAWRGGGAKIKFDA